MVYGVASRIAERAIRSTGIYLVKRYSKAFTKYDKRIFKGLYGESGGRGVRHGRDLGAVVGGLMASQGKDDLDGGTRITTPPSKFPQARRRYGNKYGASRRKYDPCDRRGRQSKFSKFNRSFSR